MQDPGSGRGVQYERKPPIYGPGWHVEEYTACRSLSQGTGASATVARALLLARLRDTATHAVRRAEQELKHPAPDRAVLWPWHS